MDRAEVQAWMNRWKEVDERSILELRRLTPELKFRQLSSLMRMARHFEWSDSETLEDARVRELWNLLRLRSVNP